MAYRESTDVRTPIGKICVYKHCFSYLNVQNVKPKNSLSSQSLVGILTIGEVTDIFAYDAPLSIVRPVVKVVKVFPLA